MREQIQKQSANETIDVPEFFSSYWFKKLMKAYTILYWFYAPQTPEKLSRIVDESFEKHYLMTKPDFDWSKEPDVVPIESLFRFKLNFRQLAEVMAQATRGTYFGIHDSYLRKSAEQRGALLIIALRRYKNANGHWPQQLEDVNNLVPAEIFIDPINNDSFVYKQTGENFTLYSKGKNGIDEGGEHEDKYSDDYSKMETIKDDVMIWPIKSKTSTQQEENEDGEQQ
jgi:hypothetical protein